MQIDVDSVDFEPKAWLDFSPTNAPKGEFHTAIFIGKESKATMTGREIVVLRNGVPAKRVKQAVSSFFVAHAKPDASIEVGATITFGGSGGPKTEYYATGTVSDDKTTVKVDVTTKDDGVTQVNVGAKASTEPGK